MMCKGMCIPHIAQSRSSSSHGRGAVLQTNSSAFLHHGVIATSLATFLFRGHSTWSRTFSDRPCRMSSTLVSTVEEDCFAGK